MIFLMLFVLVFGTALIVRRAVFQNKEVTAWIAEEIERDK